MTSQDANAVFELMVVCAVIGGVIGYLVGRLHEKSIAAEKKESPND